tara:strand:- start:199 stop:570 length:372 start_codon:yes stop_codon:yes gene_type:complete
MLSFISFSQSAIDTTSIRLEEPIAKLVIKDLITGDEAKEELFITGNKIQLLEQKIVFKDSIIFNLNTQINNVRSIVMTKDDQLGLSQELTKRLQADIKKEKLKTKLVAGGGLVAVLAALYLLK